MKEPTKKGFEEFILWMGLTRKHDFLHNQGTQELVKGLEKK